MKMHCRIAKRYVGGVFFLWILGACGSLQISDDLPAQTSSDALVSSVVIDNFSSWFSAVHPRYPSMIGVYGGESLPLPLSAFDSAAAGSLGTRYATMDVGPNLCETSLYVYDSLVFKNGHYREQSAFVIEYRKFGVIAGDPTGSIRFDVVTSNIANAPSARLPVSVTLDGITRSVNVGPAGSYTIPLSSFTGLDIARITAVGFRFATGSTIGINISFDNLAIDGQVSPCPVSIASTRVDDFSSSFSDPHPQYPGVVGIDRQNRLLTQPLPLSSFDVAPAGAMGNRYTSMQIDSALPASTLKSGSSLLFNNGSGAGVSRFTLSYNGFSPLALPATGVFHFDLVSSDLSSWHVPARLTVNGVTRIIIISKPGPYEIPLNTFKGVNLANVTSFAFSFAQPREIVDLDIVFDNLRIDSTQAEDCGGEQPLIVSLLSASMSIVEGNEDDIVRAVITVFLNRPSDDEVTVDYATVGDTALPSLDYFSPASQTISGTLVFAPGETVKTYTINIVSENDPEDDETFFVLLSNPVNAQLGIASEVVTIVNDDF